MPEVHPDELAFLARIAETPDHALPRLVFADWLDERSDPRAAWVRDDELWEWMKPDARDPIPGILAALPTRDRYRRKDPNEQIKSKACDALWLLEPVVVDAVRNWLLARPEHYPDRSVQEFAKVHPPAQLRSVRTLRAKLKETSWVEVWLAVIDLGFHGSSAAPVITALMKLDASTRWDELWGAYDSGDRPVENAINLTLARIGAAAEKAVPWLAENMWLYPESAGQALLHLRADPDLVVRHLNTDDDWEVIAGLGIAAELAADPVSLLVRTAQRYDGRVANGAVYRLGQLGPKAAAAIPALIDLSLNRTGWDSEIVSESAVRALRQIRGEAEPSRPEANGV